MKCPKFKLPAEPISVKQLLIACKLVESGGEAKRMCAQSAVTIDGQKVTDPNAQITPANRYDNPGRQTKIRENKSELNFDKMKVSRFGQKIKRRSGISQLMVDMGEGLKAGEDVLMLGGGNPSHIPEVDQVFRQMYERASCEKRSVRAGSRRL